MKIPVCWALFALSFVCLLPFFSNGSIESMEKPNYDLDKIKFSIDEATFERADNRFALTLPKIF